MAQKRTGFAKFLQRARTAVENSSETEPGTSPGSIIKRYREGELLLLSKRTIHAVSAKPLRIIFMDLAFCDFNEMPDIGEAIWQFEYNGCSCEESGYLAALDTVKRSEFIVNLLKFLIQACSANTDPNRFRGPDLFQDEDWNYSCEQRGDFTDAHGKESLHHKGEIVYQAKYLGNIRF